MALNDYDQVLKFRPADKDVQEKRKEVQKIIKRIAFEKAIAVDHPKSIGESIDINSFSIDDNYIGPRLEGEITAECKRYQISKNFFN